MDNNLSQIFSNGYLIEVVRENPLASIVVSILASLIMFGLLIRMTQNFLFAASISNANRTSLESLRAELSALRTRVENAEHDRDIFFREKVELAARVTILEESVITSRSTEERLRSENASQLKEILDLRAQVRTLEVRCAESDAKLGIVQARVITLEAAANAKSHQHPMSGGRRSTDKE